MANRTVSNERKVIFYVGMILAVFGFLVFGSVFVSGFMNFGNFDNFYERGRSMGMRAVIGMGMMIVGGVLQGVGRLGAAGAGVVLDPERARRDVEPWARMSGGVLKDTFDEVGVDLGAMGKRIAGKAEPDFDEKLRKLHQLHLDGILSAEEYEREKAEILSNN